MGDKFINTPDRAISGGLFFRIILYVETEKRYLTKNYRYVKCLLPC